MSKVLSPCCQKTMIGVRTTPSDLIIYCTGCLSILDGNGNKTGKKYEIGKDLKEKIKGIPPIKKENRYHVTLNNKVGFTRQNNIVYLTVHEKILIVQNGNTLDEINMSYDLDIDRSVISEIFRGTI